MVNEFPSLLTGFGFGPVAGRATPLAIPYGLTSPLVIGDGLEFTESMLGLPIAFPTLEVLSVRLLVS